MELKKEYRTRTGLRVINLQYVPFNSCGRQVTFPVKGTIIEREKAPGTRMKTSYTIWQENGKHSVFGDTDLDLIM